VLPSLSSNLARPRRARSKSWEAGRLC
jgi:hypothetical protein